MATLKEIWELSTVPLFDMDAPGFNPFAKDYGNISQEPGYINSDVLQEYMHADVDEITWHNLGIGVKFYKGD